jgi:hypothetical protein
VCIVPEGGDRGLLTGYLGMRNRYTTSADILQVEKTTGGYSNGLTGGEVRGIAEALLLLLGVHRIPQAWA